MAQRKEDISGFDTHTCSGDTFITGLALHMGFVDKKKNIDYLYTNNIFIYISVPLSFI